MKVVAIVAIFVISLGAVGYYAVWGSSEDHNERAKRIVIGTIPAIKRYQQEKGKYPKSLAYVSEYYRLKEEESKIFFSPQISYVRLPDGFLIRYYQEPMGPFFQYRSETDAWETTE